MKRRAHPSQAADDELNVTAFMNLMVALVPFLLLMAVFSRITILELNLPPSAAAGDQPRPALQLEVIVRGDRILLADRSAGLLQEIKNLDTGYDLVRLSAGLLALKARYPQVANATVLLEPEIRYEHLVNIMDAIRVVPPEPGASEPQAELFPDIAIGDAPAAPKQESSA